MTPAERAAVRWLMEATGTEIVQAPGGPYVTFAHDEYSLALLEPQERAHVQVLLDAIAPEPP